MNGRVGEVHTSRNVESVGRHSGEKKKEHNTLWNSYGIHMDHMGLSYIHPVDCPCSRECVRE